MQVNANEDRIPEIASGIGRALPIGLGTLGALLILVAGNGDAKSMALGSVMFATGLVVGWFAHRRRESGRLAIHEQLESMRDEHEQEMARNSADGIEKICVSVLPIWALQVEEAADKAVDEVRSEK